MILDELKRTFRDIYSRTPRGAVQAPGRVNLIGEHTDYNDGFVLPIAIERRTVALVSPREDSIVNLVSLQADGRTSLDLRERMTPGRDAWANYPKGVAAGLARRGLMPAGCDILFDSDVPIGSGLSSSASLEVAAAMAMIASGRIGGLLPAELVVPPKELALLCQRAENDFAGAPCGIMDQSIVVMARAGRAMLLDCRSGDTRQVPFDDPSIVLLVVDTQVSHDLADGGYAARRAQCGSAAAKLGLATLRDATAEMVRQALAGGGLSDAEAMRARHVVTEISRTLQAVEALEKSDYAAFGRLMYASHESLRDDFEVSCAELDAVVELAEQCEGVYGARMTGGGFGGCAIVLTRAERSGEISRAIAEGFESQFSRHCPIFATRAYGGAGVIE